LFKQKQHLQIFSQPAGGSEKFCEGAAMVQLSLSWHISLQFEQVMLAPSFRHTEQISLLLKKNSFQIQVTIIL